MTSKKIFLVLCAFALSPSVHATTVSDSASVGSQTFIDSITGLGSFGKPRPKGSVWQWNLGYTYDRSKLEDSSSHTTIIDKTSTVAAGVGFKGSSGWTVAVGLNASATPAEDLREVGPQLAIGYKFKFRRPKKIIATNQKKANLTSSPVDVATETSESSFTPALTAKLVGAIMDYTQNFSAQKHSRKGTKLPAAGHNALTQRSIRAELSGDIWEWLSVGAYETAYGYNRNVSNFLQTLDSGRAVAGPASAGMSSTVSGLPKSETGADLQFYWLDDWDLLLRYGRSILAADHSISTVMRGELSYDLSDHWSLGLGAEGDRSQEVNDTLGLAEVSYNF